MSIDEGPSAVLLAELQQRVAAIFGGVLESTEDIGPESDFFNLGGNSLRGARLVAALRAAFRVKLTMRDLFRIRTVAGMTSVIQERTASGSNQLRRDG